MTIKEIRSETHLTQKEFAEFLHIPLRTIEQWETNKRNPPQYVVELIEYKVSHESIVK